MVLPVPCLLAGVVIVLQPSGLTTFSVSTISLDSSTGHIGATVPDSKYRDSQPQGVVIAFALLPSTGGLSTFFVFAWGS